MPILIGFLILCAFLLLWQTSRLRKSAGLPGGRIVYADTSSWQPVEEPLYAPGIALTGKPDYLVEQRGCLIPVEVKTSRSSQVPFDTHIYQLAAYCILVEYTYDKRPPYGILHYTNGAKQEKTFAIDFTAALEQEVLEVVEAMQADSRRKELERSHEIPRRCERCGYRAVCDQALI